MDDFLERIELIKRKQIKLQITKSEFINKLRQNVDEGSISLFSSAFEAFSSSKNKYKGTISNTTFEIRRRREFLDRGKYLANIKGAFRQHDDHVIIDVEINGFSNYIIPFYIFIVLFYIIFLSTIGLQTLGLYALFILLHALLMFFIPYFVMRKRVKRTSDDIEKELFFMTLKDSHNL